MRPDDTFRKHEGEDYPAEVMTIGEKLVTKFIYGVMALAVIVLFSVSFSSSAHAGEYEAHEEKPLGVTRMHNVVVCDTLAQTLEQIQEIRLAGEAGRPLDQIDGCGMMMGGIPANVFSIGTVVEGALEITLIRFETISRYGDQYGWSSTTKPISSI